MKKSVFILSFIITTVVFQKSLAAQPANDFSTALKQTFNAFDTANDVQLKISLSNRLTLIAAKWNKEWVAHYYVAYSKAILSSLEKDDDKRDAYLDEADKEHDIAVSLLGKENDETYVLAALIANWRIAISPMMRSGKYAKVFRENMAKAAAINPGNPRIYYLEGMAKYSMPKFVGGGKSVAMPYLAKADSLYAKETATDIGKPYWGKAKNALYLNECKKDQN
jgi:hypothetical protein